MVISLERGANLHIAQLMPLPLTVSCFSKIQIGFTFLEPAHPGSRGQRAVKWVYVQNSENSGGSVAEWLACWTNAQKARVQITAATLSGDSLRQTAHTHCTSVHQAAKVVAALLRVAGVTAGLAESNGSIPPGF